MPAFLVVGGTGNVGSAVVRALSEAGAEVRVLTRDTSSPKAARLAELAGVRLVQGDCLEPEGLPAALDGVEAVFLGMSNSEQQVAAETSAIDAAAAAPSCSYLVKLGTCGAPGYTGRESLVQYGRYHAEIEEHLAASALKWTVLRPNDFMQNHMGDIFGSLPNGVVAYPVPGSSEATVVDTRDVGELAAALLLCADREKHAGQLYDVCGPETVSTERLASLYTAALGRPVAAVETTAEDWAANAEKAGFPGWLARAVAVNFTDFWAKGLLNYPSSSAVLEVKAPRRTMEQWITEHAPLSPPPASAAA